MNAEFKSKNTKERILDAADALFAKNGFAATSVREIAKQADVNISAINYHFTKKETLYWEVFNRNSLWLKTGIQEIGQVESECTKDFSLKVFDFFIENNNALLNTFKIFLSDDIEIPEGSVDLHCDSQMGPPGHDIFYKKITDELGPNHDQEQVSRAVSMIFGSIIHFALTVQTTMMKRKAEVIPHLQINNIRESIGMMVEAHVFYLKSMIK